MSDETIADSTEVSDNTKHQEQRNVYAELKAGLEKGRREMEQAKQPLSEIVTQPESRRYLPDEQYTFLVHVSLQGVEERATQLGLEEFSLTERPLNTSLIDQAHTWTFEGQSGFIIQPSMDTGVVVGAWSYDSGFNDMQRSANADLAAGLLRETMLDDYNQVNITQGKIAGVFIRIKEDGSELGDLTYNKQLRKFAKQNGLPVSELVVKPLEFSNEPPKVHEYNADRFSVSMNILGKLLKLDVLHSPERTLPGEEKPSEYYSRVRLIDVYGMTGGDVSDPVELSKLVGELQKILPTITNETVRKGILSVIDKYSDAPTST